MSFNRGHSWNAQSIKHVFVEALILRQGTRIDRENEKQVLDEPFPGRPKAHKYTRINYSGSECDK